MCENNLYGRGDYISEVVAEITGGQKPLSLIHGKNGMGKTSVALNVADMLKKSGVEVTFYTVEGAIQAYEEPFLRHLRDVILQAPSSSLSIGDLIATLGKNPENKLARVISGIYQDLAKKIGAEKTFGALGEVFVQSVDQLIEKAKILAGQNKDSFYTEYNDALKILVPTLNKKSVLIIDQIESASEQLWKFIEAFSKFKPNEIGLLLVINDEKYRGIECLETLRPELHALGVEPKELLGLIEQDLRLWLHEEKGVDLPNEILSRAIIELDGRPDFLKTWIDNGEFSMETLSEGQRKNYGFYDEIFNKLSVDAKKFVHILAALPLSLSVDVQLISKMAVTDEFLAISVIEELEKFKLITREARSIRLRHQHIRTFITETRYPLGPETIRNILSAVEDRYGAIDVNCPKLPLIEAKKDLLLAHGGRDGANFIISVAEKQLKEGAYRSALEIASGAEKILSEAGTTPSTKIYLIKAESYEQIGEYTNGIVQLTSIDQSNLDLEQSFRIHHQLAKLYFRLNDYQNSFNEINAAEKIALAMDDPHLIANALIIKGHLLRDTEQFGAAYDIAMHLKTDLLQRVEDELLKAHMYRSISRAMSSLFMADSIENAKQSILIAENAYSKRHQGNGYFTLGEAYRLNRDYQQSLEAYSQGLEISVSLGNTDLRIYCNLGLIASSIASGDFESANKYIIVLGELDSEKFPVESNHLRMLKYLYGLVTKGSHDDEQLRLIVSTYKESFLRIIPDEYLKNLDKLSDRNQIADYIKNNPFRL